MGYSGLFAPTEAIAKLGLLYLNGGRWQGSQLLPAAWVSEATRPHVPTGQGEADWDRGYGFQFWQSRHGYRGDGAYGQFMLILPDSDAVVAMTAQTSAMQVVLDEVWTHLLPALAAAPGTGPTGPWPTATPSLATPVGDGAARPFPEATFHASPDNEVPLLETVHLSPTDAVLTAGEYSVELGSPGVWTTTGALAASYAWSDGRLLVDIAFLEAPHRAHLTLDPVNHTFTARLKTSPLGPVPLTAPR